MLQNKKEFKLIINKIEQYKFTLSNDFTNEKLKRDFNLIK